MRCTSCGLPLSPARTMTSCPRCGTPIVSEKKFSSSPKQQQQPLLQTEAWQPLSGQAVGGRSNEPSEIVRSPMRRPGESHDHIPTSNTPIGQSPGAASIVQSAERVVTEPFQPVGTHAPVPSSPAVQSQMGQSAPELDPMWLPTPTPGPINTGGSESPVQLFQEQEYGGVGLGMRTDEQLKGVPQGEQWSGASGVQNQWMSRSPERSEGEAEHLSILASPPHQDSVATGRRSWQPQGTIAEVVDRRFAPSIRSGAGAKDGTRLHTLPQRPLRRNNSNVGFLVAGLCVITGGLMLFFIYFMALGSPDNSNSTGAVKTSIGGNVSPTRTQVPASSPVATPFPGQKYIDHAQLASSINPTSRQATGLTTTFKMNQAMYITFQLHPAGQSGAVCLFWYANNKQFLTYQLQVYPGEQSSYSYATYRGIGPGYVELYWASTTTCTDKILAQHVNFTVTA